MRRALPGAALPLDILGTGVALPGRCVDATELDRLAGVPCGTHERRHGVRRRHVAAADESASALGARAALDALGAAGVAPSEIGCIVSACSVMERALPCQAALVQRAMGLGASGIPAFDVNASCLSFLAALDVATTGLAVGRYRTVLIVCSELPSVGIDERDPTTHGLFGDGAAAVVVRGAGARPDAAEPAGASPAGALLALELATWGEHADDCTLPGGGTANRKAAGLEPYLAATHFRMDGARLFRAAMQRLPAFLDGLLTRAGVTADELALVVPHQASARALDRLPGLGLPAERIVRTLADGGNQVAASIPAALHRALADGRLARGDAFLLLGTGAGLSLGGAVLRR